MLPNEIAPHELKEMLASNDPPLLIDCREEDEWELNRIAGAVHIPLSLFAERVGAHLEVTGRLVIYCHHGMRSQRACSYLISRGVKGEVLNLAGGIDAWSREVDPSVPRY